MSYTAEQFLEKIKPMVIQDMRENKIAASLTAAQALLESNKGNSGLAVKGNNLFGIKGAYNGQSVTMPTKEWNGSQYITINAAFRKYPSWAESIADHSALFNRSPRYTNLRGCVDYRQACINVQADGYATSPTYSQSLIKTIETYRLYNWDREAIGEKIMEDKTGNPYPEPTKIVKANSRGNDARWLQVELNRYGYKLIVDGIIGPKSLAALTDFQVKHNLVPDSLCGPLTRAMLKEGGK